MCRHAPRSARALERKLTSRQRTKGAISVAGNLYLLFASREQNQTPTVISPHQHDTASRFSRSQGVPALCSGRHHERELTKLQWPPRSRQDPVAKPSANLPMLLRIGSAGAALTACRRNGPVLLPTTPQVNLLPKLQSCLALGCATGFVLTPPGVTCITPPISVALPWSQCSNSKENPGRGREN